MAVADLRDKEVDISRIPETPIVGITATTGEIQSARGIANMVRDRDRHTRVAIGGAHATYLPHTVRSEFDWTVAGEGELWGTDQARLSPTQRSPSAIIYWPDPMEDMDSIPFPARHPFSFSDTLFEGTGYGKGSKATSLITSRGCPFTCAFCQAEPRLVRFRSPENVVEEIKEIERDWDCHHFRFEDDNFTLKADRVFEICRLLEPLNIAWRCHTRPDVFGREMARAMKAAGCAEVGFGVESADQRVLDAVNKKETVEQHIKAIRTAADAGLKTKAFFMTGLPSETEEIVSLTRAFLKEAQPDKLILSRFTPYPGSDVWARPEKHSVSWIDPDFSHFWNFPDRTCVAYHDASREVLDRRYNELYALLWNGDWRK